MRTTGNGVLIALSRVHVAYNLFVMLKLIQFVFINSEQSSVVFITLNHEKQFLLSSIKSQAMNFIECEGILTLAKQFMKVKVSHLELNQVHHQ
jgi:hypothetical protein